MPIAVPITPLLRARWDDVDKALGQARAGLFCGLSEDERQQVIATGTLLCAQSGDMVLREGDAGNNLFLILSGSVAVRRFVNDAPRDLLTLQAGQIFGELAFLGGVPRTADVVANTEATILVLSRDAFLRISDAAPTTAFAIMFNVALALCQRLAIATDVQTDVLARSEKMKAQQEIDRRRTLSQMVAGVAHEINTPLGIANHAASIVSELARDVAAGRGGRETLDDIMAACRLLQDNVARADRLVQTFKTLSVSQAIDELAMVHLSQLTRDTVDLYRLKARSSKLVLTVLDRFRGDDDEWQGYPGHYAQILLNLLTNVDRYAYPEETGGAVEIEIGRDDRNGASQGFLLVVRDFGRGVSEAESERIFEPFYTTGRNKGGTGLGLPIVKNLVEESLKGKIAVKSKPGEGFEIRIELPRVVQSAL